MSKRNLIIFIVALLWFLLIPVLTGNINPLLSVFILILFYPQSLIIIAASILFGFFYRKSKPDKEVLKLSAILGVIFTANMLRELVSLNEPGLFFVEKTSYYLMGVYLDGLIILGSYIGILLRTKVVNVLESKKK